MCLEAWETSAVDPHLLLIRGGGTARGPGRLQLPSPQLLSAGKRNSKSLSFSLLPEEVPVEDELLGMLCQGKAA